MADLISRAAVLEALGHFNDYVNGDPHFLNGIETAKEITENLPTIDAIPVWWITEKFLDVLNKDKELSKAAWLVRKAWQKEQEAQDG